MFACAAFGHLHSSRAVPAVIRAGALVVLGFFAAVPGLLPFCSLLLQAQRDCG